MNFGKWLHSQWDDAGSTEDAEQYDKDSEIGLFGNAVFALLAT